MHAKRRGPQESGGVVGGLRSHEGREAAVLH